MSARLSPLPPSLQPLMKMGRNVAMHDVNTLLVFLSITHGEFSPSLLIESQWETPWKA